MTHLVVPAVADYSERIALYFEDRIIELVFPSPYLNHFPTRLTVRQSDGRRLETREIRPDFGEAFVRELEAFWSSIATGAPVRNTVEQAKRDQTLLRDMARYVASRGTSAEGKGKGGPDASRAVALTARSPERLATGQELQSVNLIRREKAMKSILSTALGAVAALGFAFGAHADGLKDPEGCPYCRSSSTAPHPTPTGRSSSAASTTPPR